jgi:signal peptidase
MKARDDNASLNLLNINSSFLSGERVYLPLKGEQMRRTLNIVILVLAIVLAVSSTTIYLSGRLGFRVDAVISDSMKPTLDVGTMVISKPVPVSELKVDDIIVFKPVTVGEIPIVHRIVEVNNSFPRTFKTKGDNPTQTIDPWTVPEANIIGKLEFSSPLLGFFTSFARSKIGLVLTLIVPSLILMILVFRSLWRELIKYVRAKPVSQS